VPCFTDSIPRQDRSFRRKRDDDFALVKANPGFSNGEIKLPQGLVQGESIALLLQKLALVHFCYRCRPSSKITEKRTLKLETSESVNDPTETLGYPTWSAILPLLKDLPTENRDLDFKRPLPRKPHGVYVPYRMPILQQCRLSTAYEIPTQLQAY
jgi:hypothetical protein